MSITLNRSAYVKLINEDIDWLVDNTEPSLERNHIIAVLEHSILTHYPDKENVKIN